MRQRNLRKTSLTLTLTLTLTLIGGAAEKPTEDKHAVRRLGDVASLTFPAQLALAGTTVGAMSTLQDGGPDWRICEGPISGKPERLLSLRYEVGSAEEASRLGSRLESLIRVREHGSHGNLLPIVGINATEETKWCTTFFKAPREGSVPLAAWMSSPHVSSVTVRSVFRQLLQAMAVLHAHGVFGSLRPLTDVWVEGGSAPVARMTGLATSLRTTAMAPELQSGGEASPESDMLEWGCLLYKATTGHEWVISSGGGDVMPSLPAEVDRSDDLAQLLLEATTSFYPTLVSEAICLSLLMTPEILTAAHLLIQMCRHALSLSL